MQCTSPFFIFGTGYVPCGRCMACRIAKTREWSERIVHEMDYFKENTFVTLTYDNEHLPLDLSIHKVDLQLFFKRLRSDLGSRKIKYFACGEYGDLTCRPHYHSIIFGMSSSERDLINSTWSKGFVYCGSVTYDSARYVAGYVMKKYNGDKAKEVYGTKEGPFRLSSLGLGKRWCEDHEADLIKNLGFTVKGIPVGMPRYYRNKLGDKLDEKLLEERRVELSNESRNKMVKRGVDELSEAEYRQLQRIQYNETLQKRQSIKNERKKF